MTLNKVSQGMGFSGNFFNEGNPSLTKIYFEDIMSIHGDLDFNVSTSYDGSSLNCPVLESISEQTILMRIAAGKFVRRCGNRAT